MRHSLIILMMLAAARLSLAATETTFDSAGLAQPADQAGVGARALAMGSAYVGVAEGSLALMWNAAGLAQLTAADVSLHHNSGLADTTQETLLIAGPLGSLGGFGAGFNYINNGEIEGRDASGNLTPSFSAGSMGVQVGWGKELLGGLSLGLAANFTTQTLGSDSYSSLAGDIAGLWTPLSGLRIGLSYMNLGGNVQGTAMTSGLRLGASLALPSPDNQLLLAVGGEMDQGINRAQVGAEDSIAGAFALRAGYQFNSEGQDYGGVSGLTLGGGIKLASLNLDYAYLPFGDLGASHRVSLSYDFSSGKAGKDEVSP